MATMNDTKVEIFEAYQELEEQLGVQDARILELEERLEARETEVENLQEETLEAADSDDLDLSPLGYRHDVEQDHEVFCPRAPTNMSPCAARIGVHGCDKFDVCLSCHTKSSELLRSAVTQITAL